MGLVHKCLNGTAPTSLGQKIAEMKTKNQYSKGNKYLLSLPKISTNYSKFFFFKYGIKCGSNRLPGQMTIMDPF